MSKANGGRKRFRVGGAKRWKHLAREGAESRHTWDWSVHPPLCNRCGVRWSYSANGRAKMGRSCTEEGAQ